MKIESEIDRTHPEYLWLQITESASSEFDDGRNSTAAKKWQNAYRIAQSFDDSDPRLACSLNNVGIASRINHEFDVAERIYRSTLEKWKSTAHWIETMQLKQRARSSLFHLRMERKHREKYNDIARRKYRKLPSAGQAGTLNNLAELLHSTNRFKEAEHFYHQALQKRIDSLGEPEYGVSIISTNLASLSGNPDKSSERTAIVTHKSKETAGFISRAIQQGWIVDKPFEFENEGRLMAAIFLTHLIDHNRL